MIVLLGDRCCSLAPPWLSSWIGFGRFQTVWLGDAIELRRSTRKSEVGQSGAVPRPRYRACSRLGLAKAGATARRGDESPRSPCDGLPSLWERGTRHREVLGGDRAEQWAFGPSASRWTTARLVIVL